MGKTGKRKIPSLFIRVGESRKAENSPKKK
jgi:hypothetical protein